MPSTRAPYVSYIDTVSESWSDLSHYLVFWTLTKPIWPLKSSIVLELAGKKERENYEEFLQQYTDQLAGIQAALDDTFGEAWDFSLDPIALQVSITAQGMIHIHTTLADIHVYMCSIIPVWSTVLTSLSSCIGWTLWTCHSPWAHQDWSQGLHYNSVYRQQWWNTVCFIYLCVQILNKVVTVFAALCSEIDEHSRKVHVCLVVLSNSMYVLLQFIHQYFKIYM